MKCLIHFWEQNLEQFRYLVNNDLMYMGRERQISFAILSQIVQVMRQYGMNEQAVEYQDQLRVLYEKM